MCLERARSRTSKLTLSSAICRVWLSLLEIMKAPTWSWSLSTYLQVPGSPPALNRQSPRGSILYGFNYHFYAKSPGATTSRSAALTPPSAFPASSPGLLGWSGAPGASRAPCVYILVPDVGHMCTKMDVAGRLLMYCVCDSEVLAPAQRAVSEGKWVPKSQFAHSLDRCVVVTETR